MFVGRESKNHLMVCVLIQSPDFAVLDLVQRQMLHQGYQISPERSSYLKNLPVGPDLDERFLHYVLAGLRIEYETRREQNEVRIIFTKNLQKGLVAV